MAWGHHKASSPLGPVWPLLRTRVSVLIRQLAGPTEWPGELRSWRVNILPGSQGSTLLAMVPKLEMYVWQRENSRCFLSDFKKTKTKNHDALFDLIWGFLVCVGICSFPCECHSWDHRVWSLWPPLGGCWHLQKVQDLDARGCEYPTGTATKMSLHIYSFAAHGMKSGFLSIFLLWELIFRMGILGFEESRDKVVCNSHGTQCWLEEVRGWLAWMSTTWLILWFLWPVPKLST